MLGRDWIRRGQTQRPRRAESEAGIVVGIAEDKDQRDARRCQQPQPGANQGAADALPLYLRQHRQRCEDLRSGFLIARLHRYGGKQHMPHYPAIHLRHQRMQRPGGCIAQQALNQRDDLRPLCEAEGCLMDSPDGSTVICGSESDVHHGMYFITMAALPPGINRSPW